MLPTTLLLAGGLAAGLVSAHKGCGGAGHEVVRRNPGGPLVNKETARGGRKRGDANPCAGYTYAPTQNLTSKYPRPIDIATILPADTAARELFNSLDSKVRAALPNTVPRASGSGYDNAADPDCWWTNTQCTSPAASLGLQKDITTVPEPGSMGLSYDDGPNCGNAPLYKWLKDNDVRASLYYIGGNILSWPLQAIDGYEGGHEMCIHSWSHHAMTSLTNEQVFAELFYSQRIMKDIVGVTPQCWRPPYGDVDNRVRMFAEGLGLRTHIWSEDTNDWTMDEGATEQTVDANYQNIINNMKSGRYATYGPVVLSHENSDKTINAALKFLPSLKSTFIQLLPIATAYNMTQPYAETDVTYPTFAQYSAGRKDIVIISSALPSSTAPSPSPSTSSGLISPSSGTSNQLAQSTSAGNKAVSMAGAMAVLGIVAATAAGLGCA